MFIVRLYLSRLYGLCKFVFSPALVFSTAGVPLLWALIQRMRLRNHAATQGWKINRPEASHDECRLSKELQGMKVEVMPEGAFGAQIFVHFSTVKAVEFCKGRKREDPLNRTRSFDSGDLRFDAMFPVHRGRKAEVEGLMADPQAVSQLIAFRSKWMFGISKMEISRYYMLITLSYGTSFFYYFPLRLFDTICDEFSLLAGRWDSALAYNGQKINK